ncbi:MAG: fumarylacetoacetate hydrolase family protein [Kineosporiaceae bacterium]|nr:fumarylacetoacetate hydrolase family protein [Kineosporiaceae bacterium]
MSGGPGRGAAGAGSDGLDPARPDLAQPDPVEAWAERIWTARTTGALLDPPSAATGSPGPLDLEAAYAVQELLFRRRLARGEHPAGFKLGYTSAAMRAQMGIDEPNSGPLTEPMILAAAGPGSVVRLPGDLRQPRVEPEVALVLGRDLTEGAPDAVRAAVTGARAALEVVDSSWHDYRFTLADNTADGSSAAYVVLGEQIPLDRVDRLPVRLVVGDTVAEADSSAAMGSPWTALGWLADHLAARGQVVPAGSVVITGGLTAAIPVAPGQRATAVFGEAFEVALTR